MDNSEIVFREERWKKNFPSTCKALSIDKYIRKSREHLDLGCGIGIFTKLLAEKYPKTLFTGQDIDKESIAIAKSRQIAPNLKFVCKKNVDDKYDSISCIFMLHEASDVLIILKNIVKSMNKDTKIFIVDFRKVPKETFRVLYGSRKFKKDFDEYYTRHNKWTIKEFETICKKAGLKTLKISKYDKYWLIYIGQKK